MAVRQITFGDAVDWLAREFGMLLDSPAKRRVNRQRQSRQLRLAVAPTLPARAANVHCADPELYEWLIAKCAPVSQVQGTRYLTSHAISLDTANQVGIRELQRPSVAYSKLRDRFGDDRVYRSGIALGDGKPTRLVWSRYTLLFPFRVNGTLVYLQGRHLNSDPKFMGLRIAKPIFNHDSLQELPNHARVCICEGVPDALSLISAGANAIGILGATSFRNEWVDLLMRFQLDIMIDSDAGGTAFLDSVSKLFRARGVAVRPVRMPPNRKDVADTISHL